MSRFLVSWRNFFLHATDAPATYGEAAGLMCLSTIALNRRWLDVASGVRPNLYLMITGDSSVARKSTAVRYAHDMLRVVEEHRCGPTDYTMEALYKWMREKDPSTGKGRSTVTLFSEEYGQDLARRQSYATNMAEDLCRLYDGHYFEKVRSKSDSITIDKPRVNVFSAVAYKLMEQYLTIDDWYSGFLMRFVFVDPVTMRAQNKLQPRFPSVLWDLALANLFTLRDEMMTATGGLGLSLSQQAEAHYLSFVDYLNTLSEGQHVISTYLARFGTNVLKLATLYQIDEDPNVSVSLNAMTNAINFAMYTCWPSFLNAYKVTSQRSPDATFDRVLSLISQPDGITRRDLYFQFGKNLHFQRVIAHLRASGAVEERIDKSPDGQSRFFLKKV